MFANRYTALIDTCVLVSAPRRDLLPTLAEAEFFRERCSQYILQETQHPFSEVLAGRGLVDADA